MNYDIKEVQKIVRELLQYSCLEEAFADMGTTITENGLTYSDVGDEYRRILIAFSNDTTI